MRTCTARGVAMALCVTLLSGGGTGSAQSRDITLESMRAEKRVALVIGNAGYATSPLTNAVNDARAMTETLRGFGFEVITRENVDQKEMLRAIYEFGDRLQRGGVGLFFFAGHGLQVGGRNFLVPIGATIRSERDVELEAVDVARVLARMEDARNRLNIVVLDACRDNPFGRSFRSTAGGLAPIDAPSGTMIAYATAPGKLARDGDGTNGLYTGELVRAMREPGLRIEDVFKRARASVRQRTNGEQVPWEASSVEGQFIFALPKVTALAPPPEEARQGSGSEYDGRYAGLITCDILPGQTVGQLKTELSITIANGQAEYQREVLRPTSRGGLGVTERGTGSVSPGGVVSLTGSAAGQTWGYEAIYRGRFDGKSLRLSGTQLWRLPDKAPHSRPCSIAVSHTE